MFRSIFILTLSVLMVVMAVGCGAGEKTAQEAEESIDSKTNAAFSSQDFTDPDTCGGCHNNIYQQWAGSMHNFALKDPVYQKLVALASVETGGDVDEYCSRCHGPIAVLSGEIPPVDGSRASSISMKGIQCDFCHTVIKGGIANGAFENQPGSIKRGPFDDAVPTGHKAQYSDLHTRGEFCGMCHDVNHPTNGLPLEATYTEWKNGPYAKEGIQCQDCHMTPGPGVTRPNPGKAVDFGPDRPHIFTHNIAGANFAVTGLLGSEEHSALAVERLKSAAKIEILNTVRREADKLNFQVKVSNVGAGHYLPTGLTETREMWLEVTVKDQLGKVLWQSGALDDKGEIKPGSVVYKTVFLDKNGHHTDKPWEAVKLGSDYRIPPKGSIVENYSAKVGSTHIKVTVSARLLYRSASQRVIDMLFKEETFKIPSLEMTSASITI